MDIEQKLEQYIPELEKKLGYVFKNRKLLFLAMTHSSYSNEGKNKNAPRSNERLEFLGDSILNACISQLVYLNMPDLEEGDMTKLRAAVVCEESLAKCANSLNIGKHILLGKGEELTGGRSRPSILADAFESILGAIFLDSDFYSVKEIADKFLNASILAAQKGMSGIDFKTFLQEVIQKKGSTKITYSILKEIGPDHNKLFEAQVMIEDKICGIGTGKTKKEAEKSAARDALIKSGEINEY
jgi:ribonuclease-3